MKVKCDIGIASKASIVSLVCMCVCIQAAVVRSEANICSMVMIRCLSTLRDRETAYVSVNGETCWTKTDILGTRGSQMCGGFYKEERFRVTGCYVTLPATWGDPAPLTVRVWTNLDMRANDESFGIDNVVVTKIEEGNAGEM